MRSTAKFICLFVFLQSMLRWHVNTKPIVIDRHAMNKTTKFFFFFSFVHRVYQCQWTLNAALKHCCAFTWYLCSCLYDTIFSITRNGIKRHIPNSHTLSIHLYATCTSHKNTSDAQVSAKAREFSGTPAHTHKVQNSDKSTHKNFFNLLFGKHGSRNREKMIWHSRRAESSKWSANRKITRNINPSVRLKRKYVFGQLKVFLKYHICIFAILFVVKK